MTADPWGDACPEMRGPDADRLAPEVAERLQRLRVDDQARDLLRAEKAARTPGELFDHGTLREVLARPAQPRDRIEGLLGWEASMVLAAMRKTGKTTFTLNLADCLLTGEPFLGRFEVRPIDGAIAVLNFEVSGGQLARWAFDVGIDPDRLLLVNLRGRANPLGRPEDQARLAGLLRARGVESLIVDPFGRAFGGLNQNDAGEVGRWLVNLDHFARTEVGARDLVLTVHSGWDGERSRGSSALEDWPDSLGYLTRGKDEDEDRRYFRAIGRDVEVDEDALSFDPLTRRLRLSGAGNRRKAATDRKVLDLVPEVLAVVIAEPGITASAIAPRLRERGVSFQKGTESKAMRSGVESGALRVEQNGLTKHYFCALPETLSPTAITPESPTAGAPGNPESPTIPRNPPDGIGVIPHHPIKRVGDTGALPSSQNEHPNSPERTPE